jgi:hypothetical protein
MPSLSSRMLTALLIVTRVRQRWANPSRSSITSARTQCGPKVRPRHSDWTAKSCFVDTRHGWTCYSVVPYGRDQFEVARRVEVAGCGVRLPGRKLATKELRSAVAEALTMAAGAKRIAAGFQAAGGPRGADLIERHLL